MPIMKEYCYDKGEGLFFFILKTAAVHRREHKKERDAFSHIHIKVITPTEKDDLTHL